MSMSCYNKSVPQGVTPHALTFIRRIMAAVIDVEKKKLKNPPLSIAYIGERGLRQPSKRVIKIDNELRSLVRKMLQTMYSEDGIGLAAPQVGVNKQLLVIDADPENEDAPPLVLINPKVTKSSKEMAKGQEGCLSIPGVYLDVIRPAEVEVSFKDEHGKPKKIKADDLVARVIQHEMDHLNGVLFVDRVENSIALNQELTKNGFELKYVQKVK